MFMSYGLFSLLFFFAGELYPRYSNIFYILSGISLLRAVWIIFSFVNYKRVNNAETE